MTNGTSADGEYDSRIKYCLDGLIEISGGGLILGHIPILRSYGAGTLFQRYKSNDVYRRRVKDKEKFLIDGRNKLALFTV